MLGDRDTRALAMSRGFFAIGVWHPKTEENIGTLWRHANLYGAAFVFTIGRRYRRQPSDTAATPMHIPLFHFESVDDLHAHLPQGAPLIGIELHPRSRALSLYGHPPSAVYLLGAEDHGLSDDVVSRCHSLVQIESPGPRSMNVAVAGSIVMWHRYMVGARAQRKAA